MNDNDLRKEYIKEHGIIYSVSYFQGREPKSMTLEIYDKNGHVRSRVELNEQMMVDLKQDIDICLGLIIEKEDD